MNLHRVQKFRILHGNQQGNREAAAKQASAPIAPHCSNPLSCYIPAWTMA